MIDARLSGDLRKQLFALAIERPLDWRVRRTDTFQSVGFDAAQQTVQIDVRLTTAMLGRALARLDASYANRSQSFQQKLAREAAATLRREAASPGRVGPIDVLVPVAWLPGPLVSFSLACGGRQVVPLSRRETADVLAGYLDAVLSLTSHYGLQSNGPMPWDVFGWCLAAWDPHSTKSSPQWCPDDAPTLGSIRPRIVEWMVDNLAQFYGAVDLAAGETDWLNAQLVQLLERSDELAQRWRDLDPGAHYYSDFSVLNPLCNPVLLHYSFMKWTMWTARDGRGVAVICADPMNSLRCFLYLIDAYLKSATALLGAGTRDCADDVCMYARGCVDLLQKLASSWPVLVPHRMAPGETVRFEINQTLTFSPKRRHQQVPDQQSRLPRRVNLGELEVPRSLATAMRFGSRAIHQMDLLARRGAWDVQIASKAYPIVVDDALTYHVEVVSSDPELRLMPRGSFVKLPQREFFSAKAREELVGTDWRYFFPYRHVHSADVFGRVSDTSESCHSFYTTRLAREHESLSAGASQQPEHGSSSSPMLLVTRYRMTSVVRATNWLVAIALALGTLVVVRASLLQAADVPTGHLDLPEYAKALTGWFVSVMILFAFEKHRDSTIRRYLAIPSTTVVISFAAFLIAVMLRALAVDAGALPYGPWGLAGWLGDAWGWIGGVAVAMHPLSVLPLIAMGGPVILGILGLWPARIIRQAQREQRSDMIARREVRR